MKYLVTILFVLHFGAIHAQTLIDIGVQRIDQRIENVWEFMVTDPEEAYNLAFACLEEATAIGYEKGQADCANILGVLNLERQEFDKAQQFFNMALQIRIKLKDQSGQASVFHNMAALLTDQADYPEAIRKAFSAIKIWETLHDINQLGKAYNTLANIYMCNGDYDLGLAYTQQSLAYLLQTDDYYAIADAKYNLAERYYQLEDLAKAEGLFQDALLLYRDSFYDISAQADVHNALGVIALEKGNLEEAARYLYQSRTLFQQMEDKLGLFDVHLNLGLLEETKHNFKKAIQYYQQAESIMGKQATLEDQLYLFEQYIAVFQSMGDFEQAFAYQNQATNLRDSIFNEKKQEQIASLQIEFESEKLAKENIAKGIENQKKTFQRNFFMVATAGLLLLLLVGVYALKQHKKANVLVLQQKEIRHQREIGTLMKEQEYQLVKGRLDGQVAERQRLATEVNDGLASKVAALNWQIESIKEQFDDHKEPIEKVQNGVRDILQHLTTIVQGLKIQKTEEYGLEKALTKLKAIVEQESAIKMEIRFLGSQAPIPPHTEIAVYRILRELVANVIKHAKATKLSIEIRNQNGYLHLQIQDNGIGFDPEQLAYLGLGLKRLELLVQELEGNFSINSSFNKGTTVVIDLPI